MTDLNRRRYLQAALVAAAAGLAGCADSASATGTLATRVRDQPGDIADFESCVVTVQGIWLKPRGGDDNSDDDQGDDGAAAGNQTGRNDDESAGGGTDDDEVADQDADDVDEGEGRTYHEFDEPQEADLVELQDGATQLVDEREIDVGEYEFLQLDVSDVDGVLTDSEAVEVDTPGNAPLQFNERFEIRDEQRTTFVADFTPVRRGQTGRYLLQPVARGTRVEYENRSDATDDDSDAADDADNGEDDD